ncbi:TIR domain-containing protein [Mycobacterium ostraviense]|uniref:Molecular chaperone Tir n=1 Tax=Mycobacterium ostraviense TaxID=2738409 RepID=A0A163T2V7_9MYCO|nr:TIR domain-containing protein [Mycobacterium ostraviense]KZS54864.1 molecular chaperone Tir [Mycobacterium ostraviense]UGT93009.1 TIR domain-containing protein [Mycobacterium ostraviense]
MSYRNKTYVAFASEDIHCYRLMEAWRDNDHIDFDFFDAHDLFISRDTSSPETIKRNLRERMKNAKQIVLLGTAAGRRKGSDGRSFLAHEIKVAIEFNLPIVIVNLDGKRIVDTSVIPQPLLDAGYYTVSVSFQPGIIRFAQDNYSSVYAANTHKVGPHYYEPNIYANLGL